MHHLYVGLRKRIPYLVPLLGLVCYLGFVLRSPQGTLATAGLMLLVCALIITMGVIIAWPFAEFISIPFANLYFPNREGSPPLSYHLADYYMKELRYEEALAECEKICHYHPRELTPWAIRIELLLEKFSDLDAAQDALQEGQHALHNPDKSKELQSHYDKALAKLCAKEIKAVLSA